MRKDNTFIRHHQINPLFFAFFVYKPRNYGLNAIKRIEIQMNFD